MFELVVIWYTGEKEIFKYDTEQEAEKAEKAYKNVFGKQVEWCGVRRKI